MNTMQSILEETKKLIQFKQAEFKKRSDAKTTTSVTENTDDSVVKAVPATKPTGVDAKARTEEMDRNVNEKGNTTTGAGDDSPVVHKNDLKAEDQAQSVTSKPLLGDDANAKTASAVLANDLMTAIRGYQQTAKSAEVKTAQAEAPAAPAEAPADKTACDTAVKTKAATKPAAKVEVKPEVKVEAKKANTDEIELTTDILAKIASLVISQEEGMELVQKLMAKEAGAEAANELVNFVNEKQAKAEYEQGAADAQAMINQSIYDAGVKDTLAKIAAIEKKSAAGQALSAEDQALVKLGQELANDAVADMGGAMGGAMGGQPPAMPPEAMPPGMPAEGGGEQEISVEELAAALDQLVSSGAIQPEDVQKILEYLASAEGGQGGEMPPEAAPAEAAPAEAAPAEAAPEKPEDKEAAAKKQAKITKLANTLAVEIGKASAKK